jgi:hypothetical protein
LKIEEPEIAREFERREYAFFEPIGSGVSGSSQVNPAASYF